VQALANNIFFFPHPCDHSKYIHCDISGNYYIQSCPHNQYFDPTTFVCTPWDSQPVDPQCP
jgi:hypothetical protein